MGVDEVTDKQVDRLIARLDKRIMRTRVELEKMTLELADVIHAVKELREDRDEYERRWLAS
jgi:hypothetical protein